MQSETWIDEPTAMDMDRLSLSLTETVTAVMCSVAFETTGLSASDTNGRDKVEKPVKGGEEVGEIGEKAKVTVYLCGKEG